MLPCSQLQNLAHPQVKLLSSRALLNVDTEHVVTTRVQHTCRDTSIRKSNSLKSLLKCTLKRTSLKCTLKRTSLKCTLKRTSLKSLPSVLKCLKIVLKSLKIVLKLVVQLAPFGTPVAGGTAKYATQNCRYTTRVALQRNLLLLMDTLVPSDCILEVVARGAAFHGAVTTRGPCALIMDRSFLEITGVAVVPCKTVPQAAVAACCLLMDTLVPSDCILEVVAHGAAFHGAVTTRDPCALIMDRSFLEITGVAVVPCKTVPQAAVAACCRTCRNQCNASNELPYVQGT
jgi:hypothetical protein